MSKVRTAKLGRPALLVAGAVLLAAAVGPAAWAAAPQDVESPSAAADGRIALVQHRQIVTISPDGTDKTVLTSNGKNYAPAWSPDGATIAYVHQAAGQRNLWIMNADGSGQTAVTSTGDVSTGGASWSPDGLRLAFGGPCVQSASTPAGVCDGFDAYALDTVRTTVPYGAPVTVLGDEPGYPDQVLRVLDGVAWSPEGDDIAFASDGYGTYPGDEFLLVLDLSTAEVAFEVAVGAGGVYGNLGNPAFDADGERLGYDAFIEGQPEIIHQGIQVCGYPDGGCDAFREVLHDSDITFAPTQDRVALVRDLDRDRVVVANAHGRDRVRLARGSQPIWQPAPAA